ncbi:hypothetical protein J4207_04240 [Candidatus Woesearchaeota archaeon]|nr:hypothetical protein [Candidatus Woesearchaeota archaeon]HLC80670.1 hypothetical protein [Candidatus Nanoarchaeia archaeon]
MPSISTFKGLKAVVILIIIFAFAVALFISLVSLFLALIPVFLLLAAICYLIYLFKKKKVTPKTKAVIDAEFKTK